MPSMPLAIDFLLNFFFLEERKNSQLVSPKITSRAHGTRPACLWSPSTSQMEGERPSEPCAQRRPRNDVATAFAAAHDNMAPQRMRHAAPHASARPLSRAALWLWPTATQTTWSQQTNGHPFPWRAPPTSGSWAHQFGVRAFLPSPCNLQHHPICIRS